MDATGATAPLELFSTCPPSGRRLTPGYQQRVIDAARWSERAGCRGMLIYTDNSLLDPWVLAQLVLAHTEALNPLVAVQPVYAHPYTVAKKVVSLAVLYHRRLYLNMVAGGFHNDLTALNGDLPHDRRYHRLCEYTRIVEALFTGAPITVRGEFYTVKGLRLEPPLSEPLRPGIFVSGSSPAAQAAARALGATLVQYPAPAPFVEPAPTALSAGIRIGIVTRPADSQAWEVARARFPESRPGQLTHQLATRLSDSSWHSRLSQTQAEDSPYWLHPFRNYYTFCPYLVGSYAVVATEVSKFLRAGYRTIILDVPADEDDLQHTMAALRLAVRS